MISSSTTDLPARRVLPPKTRIQGFVVEGVLRRTATAVTYEATQLSLGRTVALRVVDDPRAAEAAELGARLQALVHHAGVVPVYETGRSPHGVYVASRLTAGPTLAAEIAAGRMDARRAVPVLRQVAEALGAAHAAGVAHGRLTADAVRLTDGDVAQLDEFSGGSGDLERDAAQDDRALGRLVRELTGVPRLPPQAGSGSPGAKRDRDGDRRPRTAGLAILAATAAAALAIEGTGTVDPARLPAPPASADAVRVGSSLAPGASVPFDCLGGAPETVSPPCTLLPTDAGGRELRAPEAGVVRRWAVRGAQGTLALQVLRRVAGSRFTEAHRSQYVVVPDEGPHAFRADVPVRRGDRLAVEVAAGAGLGLRRGPSPAARRWRGPLEALRTPRPPDPQAIGSGELLVRFQIAPGARPAGPDVLRGAAARRAPPGDVVDDQTIELPGDRPGRLAVVRLPAGIAVDLLRGRRRLARVAVPDADPAGRLLELEQGFARDERLRLRWSNPGGGPIVIHDYSVGKGRLRVVN